METIIQSLEKWFHWICRPRKPRYRHQVYDSMETRREVMTDYSFCKFHRHLADNLGK